MNRLLAGAVGLLALLVQVRLAAGAEALDPAMAKASDDGAAVLFYDIRALGVEGQGWSDIKAPYDRLPAKAQETARAPVWNLSHDSAGLCVRFESDATAISARWTLTQANLAMPHMAATGVSGLDLYVKTAEGQWHWMAVGKPVAQTNTVTLVGNLPAGRREYLLYLPLYNGVTSVEIGIPKGAMIAKAAPRPAERTKPIVFYGTSITQGGCASRPGMCHPAILGRRLDRPVINLGFSGNGTMDADIAALLGEIDAAVYVIDCLPNMTAKTVAERTGPLVTAIRKARPTTPILLVEDRTYADAFLIEGKAQKSAQCRAALRAANDALVAAGDKNIGYLAGEKLLAADGEDTVDSSHPTDLGFVHQADAFQAALEPLLHKETAKQAEQAPPARAVSAMRILKENCVSCHNPEKRKGKLVLTTREGALAGGEDGPALEVGNARASRMIGALSAEADPHMPPKGQLTEGEIKVLSTWIEAGAPWDAHALATATSQTASTRPIVLRPLPASYRPVLCMALSPDQKRLAVGRGDRILLYDLSAAGRPMVGEMATPNDVVQSLAWSGDGRWLTSGGFRRIGLWDGQSGARVGEITGLSGRVTALAFVPNEPVLIAGEGEVASAGMLSTWRIPEGTKIAQWTAHEDSILAMKVSGDGKRLVTAGADKLVKVWDLAAHKEVAKLEGHAGPVMALALSGDGATLASAGSDEEIKVWKVATKEQTASLLTNPAGVTDLVWVNEKTLLSTSEDGQARFSSEASKERAERVFSGAPDVLYCAAVTADGKTIFAGCHDGNVYVWTVATGKLESTLAAQGMPQK